MSADLQTWNRIDEAAHAWLSDPNDASIQQSFIEQLCAHPKSGAEVLNWLHSLVLNFEEPQLLAALQAIVPALRHGVHREAVDLYWQWQRLAITLMSLTGDVVQVEEQFQECERFAQQQNEDWYTLIIFLDRGHHHLRHHRISEAGHCFTQGLEECGPGLYTEVWEQLALALGLCSGFEAQAQEHLEEAIALRSLDAASLDANQLEQHAEMMASLWLRLAGVYQRKQMNDDAEYALKQSEPYYSTLDERLSKASLMAYAQSIRSGL